MISNKEIMKSLDVMIPNPKCELSYNKDYELLMATVLSAQSTDKTVNKVTDILFKKYDLNGINNASVKEIEKIIKPIGTYTKKSMYIKGIAKRLVEDCNGIVPNNQEYLRMLPGVGRKTANVVLSNLFDVPAFAVDTHVSRIAKRLEIASSSDSVYEIEKKLMNYFPKESWSRLHHQFVLFGRYICKSKHPLCNDCLFNNKCQYKEK